MHRWIAVVAVVAVLASAGCAADERPRPADGAAATASDTGVIRPEDLPGETLDRLREMECSDEQDPELRVPQVDVSNFRWEVPDDFHEVGGFYEVDPAEGDYLQYSTFAPLVQDHHLDIVAIMLYPQLERGPLVSGCMQLNDAAARERIAEYNSGPDSATPLNEPSLTHVGGLPAYEMDLYWEDQDMTIHVYYIFGNNQLVEIECQWNRDEETIMRGCQEFVDSVYFE